MWKNNFGTSDVFWVEENQVSKTTKSKEFIEKGSFMIKGKKNIIKNIKLELYFGYEEKELQIEKRKEKYHNFISSSFPYCKKCVKITPGNLKQKELSKKIVKFLKVRKIENLPKYIPQNCYVSSFK